MKTTGMRFQILTNLKNKKAKSRNGKEIKDEGQGAHQLKAQNP